MPFASSDGFQFGIKAQLLIWITNDILAESSNDFVLVAGDLILSVKLACPDQPIIDSLGSRATQVQLDHDFMGGEPRRVLCTAWE